jgi:hypothetical protein
MTQDTWSERDLPVLRAVVDIYEQTGRKVIRLGELAKATGFDEDTVTRAARVLNREPYFELKGEFFGGGFIGVGAPTSDALRTAGQWPSAETMLERLISALELSSDDDELPDEERTKRKRAAAWLRTTMYQVAVNALGGAGGNLITGG